MRKISNTDKSKHLKLKKFGCKTNLEDLGKVDKKRSLLERTKEKKKRTLFPVAVYSYQYWLVLHSFHKRTIMIPFTIITYNKFLIVWKLVPWFQAAST